MADLGSWLPLVLRACTVGILGGAGLVLTQIYSRRGPMIYPVYAAILAALTLAVGRFEGRPYAIYLAAVLSGMVVATVMAFIAAVALGARQRQRLHQAGRPIRPGHVPWWSFPLVAGVILAASAAAAYVAS